MCTTLSYKEHIYVRILSRMPYQYQTDLMLSATWLSLHNAASAQLESVRYNAHRAVRAKPQALARFDKIIFARFEKYINSLHVIQLPVRFGFECRFERIMGAWKITSSLLVNHQYFSFIYDKIY